MPPRVRTMPFLVALWLGIAGGLGAADGPPIDPDARRPPELIELVRLDRSITLDLRYATPRNFTGHRLYPDARALLQRPAAEALVRAHRALVAAGYGLVVLDAYRPWRVTKALWDATPPDRRAFVADPALGSRHNRGAAVDVTLVRADGSPVAMPSDYDEMSERSAPTYAGGSDEARRGRDLLRATMEREGFFVHPAEWWHFDYKDWRDYPVLDVPFAEVAANAPAAASGLDLVRARVVDLTWPFDESTLYWPNAPSGFTLTRLAHGATAAGYFYAANSFCAPEHGGTHLDAPEHFADGGWTADAIPAGRLVGPAVVIDVAERAARDVDYRLTPADVASWEGVHGRIPPGAIVLLRTGWGARWPDRMRYFGDDTPGRTTALHFPSYGRAAAELLTAGRRVAAIGVDTASIDHGPSSDFPVHRVVGAANVPAFENVAHLEELPATGAWVAALPMKVAGGSGGPLRIIAFVPR